MSAAHERISTTGQKLGALCGPIATVLFFFAVIPMAHFLPPPSAKLSADAIAAHYLEHNMGIRWAVIFFITGIALLVALFSTIASQMWRMQGHDSVTYTYIALGCGVFSVVVWAAGMMSWGAAAFRPERSPELILALQDVGMLAFVMPAFPGVVQLIAIGLGTLADKSPTPVYPRWVAWFNFWVAAGFSPGMLVVLFHSGPFAWGGLFGFFVPLTAFTAWNNVMAYSIYKAAKRQEAAAESGAAATFAVARGTRAESGAAASHPA